jgi:hypothetical protein
VESFSITATPIAFRDLCERAVPRGTRLLVLDLDRTVHFGRNMGELLGWEISAYKGYGPSYLTELEPHRPPGRLYLARRRPLAALRYLGSAFRVWVPPGLFYLLWCKLAAHLDPLRRRSYLRFGPEPVQAVQRIPQYALLREIGSLPEEVVRELAGRVWQRHRHDLIVEREDLAWLRQRCPGIHIVLSSASPREVVGIASAALGVDEVIGSSWRRINGGRAKLEELRARYPDLLGVPGIVTVGMSDTGYGEDHCWTEAFSHLVDVNSTTGFPPIVPASSPLRAICSAQILTRAEKDARARGEEGLDPRRGASAVQGIREFGARELEALLAPVREVAERLASEIETARRRIGDTLERAAAELAALDERLDAVAGGGAVAAPEARRAVRAVVEGRLSAQRALARRARPLSEVTFALARELERSRQVLDRGPMGLGAPSR